MRIATIILAILVSACGAREDAGDGPAAPQISQLETAPGVTLYVEKYGDGPNVVIAPGRLFMADEFDALAAPDRTLILYDMRNRGASARVADGVPINIVEDVRDLEALRAHFGAERVSVIGYSYLGVMVALYAAEHPHRVERIVQVGPAPRDMPAQYPPDLTAGADTLSPEGLAAQTEAEQAGAAAPDQAALCELQHTAASFWLVGNPANARRVQNTCVYENEWPAATERHFALLFSDFYGRDFPAAMFAALSQPALIIHGTRDRNAPYGSGREWAVTLPGARLITVEGAAHNIWLDDANVIPDIDGFLRGDWPARAEDLG